MELREAIEQAKKGNAVLFTGAGFSYGATNLLPEEQDRSIPTAFKLAAIMADLCEVDGTYQLPAISQFFETKKGSGELVRLLLNQFSISAIASHHRTIARIPWRRVYTTNYDNCFEFAALQEGIDWTPITTDTAPTASHHRCVHINGHVSNLTEESLSKQLKLTHSSYSAETFVGSKWSHQFRQDIFASRAIIFIGYSMADIDISRIIHQIPELRSRTFFITSDRADPVSEALISPYGSVHSIGIEGFAKLAAEVEIVEDDEPYQVTWLERYEPPESAAPPEDSAAHDLILKGVVSSPMMAWALAEKGAPYAVRRVQAQEIIKEIQNGRRWLVVHSDLGNGKSILKEQLSYLLSKLDYDVYFEATTLLGKMRI